MSKISQTHHIQTWIPNPLLPPKICFLCSLYHPSQCQFHPFQAPNLKTAVLTLECASESPGGLDQSTRLLGSHPPEQAKRATQQEVSSGRVSEASSAAPHRSHYSLNHIPLPPNPHGKIVFHETGPWCQKGWGPLLQSFWFGRFGAGGVVKEFAFLTGSPVMLILLVWWPHFANHCLGMILDFHIQSIRKCWFYTQKYAESDHKLGQATIMPCLHYYNSLLTDLSSSSFAFQETSVACLFTVFSVLW